MDCKDIRYRKIANVVSALSHHMAILTNDKNANDIERVGIGKMSVMTHFCNTFERV